MAGQTPRFGFTTLDSTYDTLDERDFKFSGADRILLDRVLRQAAERHHHVGNLIAPTLETPGPAPHVEVEATGGVISANRTVYYRASIVDERGQEHVASRTATAYTNPPVFKPGAFTVQPDDGVLMPGDYVYAISGYTWDSACETTVSQAVSAQLTQIGGFTLSFPGPSSGTTGFNVYRKGPTDQQLTFVKSLALPVTTWTDDGTTVGNSLRGVPTTNTTSSTSSIEVSPAAELGVGETWKVYRSYSPTEWDHSLLIWSANASVIDTGHATQVGAPPAAGAAVGNPPKLNLGSDVEGVLPPALVVTERIANFTFEGPVTLGPSVWQWVNEFDQAAPLTVRAALGRGSVPIDGPVEVTIEKLIPGFGWIRGSGAEEVSAVVPAGETIGPLASVSLALQDALGVGPGEAFRVVVLQSGGGATPTAVDLSVVVTFIVRHGSDTQTYTWEM